MRDAILFWNAVALEANRVSHTEPDKGEQRGPTLSSRAIAIVHLAMYDAYAAVLGAPTHPRYLAGPAAPAGANSAPDAAAGAAYRTLSVLYPAQQEYFDAQLAAFDATLPPAPNSSFGFGVQVGDAMLAKRANDPDARDAGYRASLERGRHRVDPDNPGQGFHAPYYGAQSECFAVTQRHALDVPPLDDGEYDAALREVTEKGIKPELMGTLSAARFPQRRTAEESLVGVYWGYDGAARLGTPPRMFNQIVRQVSAAQGATEADNARLFALVNAALGDAGILAWEQKYCHDFWRPIVGIREHDRSLGPSRSGTTARNDLHADADPHWLPFGAPSTNVNVKNFTPNFPAYPSGHATFGAAALHMTRLFFGIKKGHRKGDTLLPDHFVSEEFNGGNRDNRGTVRPRHKRSFRGGLWDMIIENGQSRVYLGVHWVFDAFAVKGRERTPDLGRNVGGVPLGLAIAEDIWMAGKMRGPRMTAAGTAAPPIATPPSQPVGARVGMPTVPIQPADVGKCANQRRGKGKAARAGGTAAADENAAVSTPYPGPRSAR